MPFGLGSFVGDLVGGFNQGTTDLRRQHAAEADRQAERDTRVFEALANADDPEIRAAAVTGLLTGNHPARAFDKFYGTVGTHPAFETIKGLVANGHQPFLDPSARKAAEQAAELERRPTAWATGVQSATGEWPDQDTIERAMMPPGTAMRTAAPRAGNGEYLDESTGEWTSSAIIEHNGEYSLPDGTRVRQVRNWRLNAPDPHAATAGAVRPRYTKMTVADFRVRFGDHRLLAGHRPEDVVEAPLLPDGTLSGDPSFPPPSSATFSFFPTSTGVARGVTRGPGAGSFSMVPGTSGMGAREPASASASYLMQLHKSILDEAALALRKPVSGIQAKGPDVIRKADEIARSHGFRDLADLETQIGQAGGRIDAATPGPSTPPPPTAPAGPLPAAPPPGRQASPPAGTPRPQLDPIAQKVLDQLNLGANKRKSGG